MSEVVAVVILFLGALAGYLAGRAAGEESVEARQELRWMHVQVSVVHLSFLTKRLLAYNDELLARQADRAHQQERSILVAQKRTLELMQTTLWGGELPPGSEKS